jgi:signal transduction histidine kinase
MERTSGSAPAATPIEGVTRSLRHELGDLLQTIYAAVAVLRDCLPPEATLERTILADLRTRAERTRDLLDIVHDLVAPVTLSPTSVDLAELVTSLAASATVRFPHCDLRTEITATPPLQADPRWLARLGTLLLGYACEISQGPVRVGVRMTGPNAVAWTVRSEDGTIPAEHLETVQAPFAKPGPGSSRLVLPLVRRLTEWHHGRFAAGNGSAGGFEVQLLFPLIPGEPLPEAR